MADENLRLRAALRDLVALSTIPAWWIGIEPRMIAVGLADILAGSLGFDFAFVRLLDPTGGVTIDVTSGCATREFLDWLQAQLSTLDESLRKQIIPNDVGFDDRLKSLRGIIIPIGFNAYAGLVAVGCERSDFPTETDRMLLTVAANHAATAFRSVNLIHERRRAEEEVRQARDELEMRVMERTAELQRTMAELTHMNRVATAGGLLASIAHEINQPLTGIVTAASAARRWLALREPSIGEARNALDQIESDGHRAGEIIASLRGMFKKETQARNPIDINKQIFTVLAIVRHELQKHGVEVRTELDGSLPALEGDSIQLQQVVLNLVMNAIEAMQSAAPRILSIRSCVSKPNFVHVAVEDTGTGIDPSNHNHIFNPMFTTWRCTVRFPSLASSRSLSAMPRVVIDPALPDRASLDNEIAPLPVRSDHRRPEGPVHSACHKAAGKSFGQGPEFDLSLKNPPPPHVTRQRPCDTLHCFPFPDC